MIKTTAAYKEAMKNSRILHHRAEITFKDGTTHTVEDMDLYTFQISDGTSNTGSFDLGSAIAQQLMLKINNTDGIFDGHDFCEAVIVASAGAELLDGSIEWLEKGVYTAEPGEDTGASVTVKAFDNMTKFDKEYSLSKLVYPATLGEIVRDACSCCDVTLAPDSAIFDNYNFIVQTRPEDSSLTFRQALQWVCQIACKYARINKDGKLSLQWYDTALLESVWASGTDTIWTDIDGNAILDADGNEIIISSTDIETEENIVKISDLATGSTIQTDDVVITGICVTEESQEGDITYRSGSVGYMLNISGNKLIQDGSGETVASYLGERLNGIQFRPLSVNTPADPAREAGDLGLVTDRRGRYYKTIFTNVTYTAHASQNLICGAEAPTRLSSTRFSQATQVYKELRKNIYQQKTEWDRAFGSLQEEMKTKNGLFPVREVLEDGSAILYFCDKPALADSSIVVKFSAAGWGMSTDGGKNWNSGWLVDGTMIASILNAIGINAGWINTGALTVQDPEGKIIFQVDMDKKSVYMDPDSLLIGDMPLEEKLTKMENAIALTQNMTLQLSNDMETIAVDAEGNIAEFPSVTTQAQVMYGSSDVSSDCSYTITKSAGIAGNWDGATRTYTVTGLTADKAWIDIRAIYLGMMASTKRFNVSKIYAGQDGQDGEPGKTYTLKVSDTVVKKIGKEDFSPCDITFSAYVCCDTERTPYKGRFVIFETYDETTWETVYISAEDESEVHHSLYSTLTTADGSAMAAGENDTVISTLRDVKGIKCSLYSAGGTENLMDMQSVSIVQDISALTQEEIVEILSDNGKWKGIRYLNGHLYISFDAALGGTLTLGGANNGNGRLRILDAGGSQVGYIDNTGANFGKGTFSGELKAAKGTFNGDISGASGTFSGGLTSNSGNIGGWKINKTNKTLLSENERIILDAKNNKIQVGTTSTLDVNGLVTDKISVKGSDTTTGALYVDNGAASYLKFYNAFNGNGTDEIQISGNLKVHGTKSRTVKTENFSRRLLYCYETPTPTFGDLGCGKTNDAGIAIIDIDPVFAETVNSNLEYQVFLQKEGKGDLWIGTKETGYFVVEGTPNLKFSWEIKCIQRDFETFRIEESEIQDSVEADFVNASEEILQIIQEDLETYDTEMEELT